MQAGQKLTTEMTPESLEEELKRAVASPPANMTTFLDGWVDLVHGLPVDTPLDRRAHLLVEAANQYYLDGRRLPRRLETATEALRVAEECGDQRLLRRCLSIRGLIVGEIGQTSLGLQSLERALKVATDLDDHVGIATAWVNIAAVLQDGGFYLDSRLTSESVLRMDLQLAEPFRSLVHSRCHYAAAINSLQLHQPKEALRSAQATLDAIGTLDSPEQQQACALAEAVCATALLSLDRVPEAKQHALAALAWAERCGYERPRFDTQIAMQMVAARDGDADVGLAALEHLLESAPTPSLKAEWLRAVAETYERAGRPDAALKRWQELLALTAERRAAEVVTRHEGLLRSTGTLAATKSNATEAKAAAAQALLTDRVNQLVEMAVRGNVAAGHDPQRPFRVGTLAAAFATAEGASPEEAQEIKRAAQLADIGMVAQDPKLIGKPARLAPFELKVVAEHTTIGADLLASTRLDTLQLCIDVARLHHERHDGTGPHGVAGAAIPRAAQITTLADCFDAMTHRRPYRPEPLSVPAAVRELLRAAGTQFEPELANRFARFVQELYWSQDNFEAYLSTDAMANPLVAARGKIDQLRRAVMGET